MYCWKCGNENPDGASCCVRCGARLEENEPVTMPGAVMHYLYKEMGASKIFSDSRTLADALERGLPDEKALCRQIRHAMDQGLGDLYMRQLPLGNPGSDFYQSVTDLLTGRAGFSKDLAGTIIGYFNEMIGWKKPENSGKVSRSSDPGRQSPPPVSVSQDRQSPPPASAPQDRQSPSPAPAPQNLQSPPPASASAKTGSTSEKKKSTKGGWVSILFAIGFAVLAYINYHDMHYGDSYMVWLGFIPVHYIFIPASVISLIVGIRTLIGKDK